MFCFVALLVFSVLGLFSATHRPMAREALDCVLRRVTFRPCQSGFREKVQAGILSRVMLRSPGTARLLRKHFEALAWIFMALMIWSTFAVVRGGFNYYLYGSCGGLNASGFCVFDPSGEHNQTSGVSASCDSGAYQNKEDQLSKSPLPLTEFPQKNSENPTEVVFIGCYGCEYTRKTYALLKPLLEQNPVHWIFVHFPVKPETAYLSSYVECLYRQDPEKFWTWNDMVFALPIDDVKSEPVVAEKTRSLGFDIHALQSCLESPETRRTVLLHQQQIANTGLYGTPTIFINGKPYVGPKPERVYQRAFSPGWW